MSRWPGMDDSKRCTATVVRTGERCRRARIPGATVCATHGGSIGRVKDAAARRVQEQQAMTAAQRLVANVDLSRYSDPFDALEFAVSYSYALAERLAAIVSEIPGNELRYPGKTGEQLRGEVTAVQRTLDSVRQAATDALKLNLAERRLGIQEQVVGVLARALDVALEHEPSLSTLARLSGTLGLGFDIKVEHGHVGVHELIGALPPGGHLRNTVAAGWADVPPSAARSDARVAGLRIRHAMSPGAGIGA